MTEPWIERVIREAQEQGRFDDVAGTGEPILDLDEPYDPAWWARRWVARERRRDAARDLMVRVQRQLPTLLASDDEEAARAGLEALNRDIEAHNVAAGAGARIDTLDVAALLAGRRSRRAGRGVNR